jgi:hypothetical protein
MAEFKLDRFKYTWRGDWSAGTDYNRDDIVRVGGKSYVCIVTHTASPSFFTDLNYILPDSQPPQPQPKWTVMIDGRTFQGEWESGRDYNLGDIILIGGTLFICNGAHTSTAFEANNNDWSVYAEGIKADGAWQSDTQYGKGDIVSYGGYLYKAVNGHTSAVNLEQNLNDWTIFFDGWRFVGDWESGTFYGKGDIIKYGGSLFRTIRSHTSENYIDPHNFQIEAPGFEFSGDWQAGVAYNQGDYVKYGGNLYYALVNNIDNPPLVQEDSTVVWVVAAEGHNHRGDWTVGETYYPGDIVRRGGNLYEALEVVNAAGDEDSTLDYLEPNWWRLLIPGQNYQGIWASDTLYQLNDIVYYFGTAYKCNQQHTSSIENFPGDNGQGFEYWDVLIQGGLSGLNYKGDLLTYNLTRDEVGDGSSIGPTNIPIGSQGQLLSINNDNSAFWRDYLSEGNVVYVAPNGMDAEGRGLTPNNPFKTVKYACEYVEDNFNGSPAKVAVAAGRYEEVCPIIVPAYCVVMGDELRSTTIIANSAKDEYAIEVDYIKTLDWLTRVTSLLDSVLINEEILPTTGNTVSQDITQTASSTDVADRVRELLQDWRDYVEFRTQNGDVNPTLSGSNTENTDQDFINAVAILEANRSFLKQEAVKWLESRYVDTDSNKTEKDFDEFYRAILRDIKYSGNYATLNAAVYYANSVLGSQLTDMFYLRDKTGLRNCTIEGLQGGLNPPGVFELYQRPTGGAYCSLDPGWGPDDERTWILNRSPYIQGVTTIGTNCVGQKIDGSLHNGGNKSFVSNDFTQVLSDGIGAWVTNGARAELVSVFTYYCAVGYLAEEGGIIRATNGNCSYGKYGAIANGLDPNETPRSATVDNRNNEAVIQSTFAGEFTDKIFAFEYAHAGEEYTDVNLSILGSGQNASAEIDDFRFGGVFQARIIEPEDSGIAGGAGYQEATGNAQTGTATQITISATDGADTNDYDGMRIILTSGTGTGQYGIVNSLNTVSKVMTVVKESDGTPGWDHIVPGTPIESLLTTNTTYRIEPRILASHPGFDATAANLGPAYNYADVKWGQTTEIYNNVEGDFGTGDVVLANPLRARFNIIKRGRNYEVTMINPGIGYIAGDTITIPGDELGGDTPANDLTIRVTESSEDSTNSIVSFSSEGIAFEGRWVVTSNGTNNALWSDDGAAWVETTLPSAGAWTRVINGNNRFFALRTESTNEAAYSYDGKTWIAVTLPSTQVWQDVAWGNGRFVAIPAATQDYAYSSDGVNWTSAELPAGDDSTGREWKAIGFGADRFVALSGELDNDVAYSSDGINWSVFNNVLPNGSHNWIGCEFGVNRFVAVSSTGNTVAYSLDRGETWTEVEGPTPDDSTGLNWKRLKANQGLFMLIGDTGGRTVGADPTAGPINYMYSSEDGISWTQRTLTATQSWTSIDFGYPNDLGRWIAVAESSSVANTIRTGVRAKFRSSLSTGIFNVVKIWDPGSGYDESNPCTLTVFDNSFTTGLVTDNRLGNRVLGPPTFINRGTGYRSSNTTATITGDGYADIIPADVFVTLDGLEVYPGPGAQFQFTGLLEPDTADPTDLRRFTAVTITPLGDDGSGNGTLKARFRISPSLELDNNLAHGTTVSISERYSQCRISGHDFLDIGTGNFIETNYPDLYAEGNFYEPLPANEVYESNGGRVFYTSTDQDGNFRAGELFAVEQATGIVTISADFFDLGGLSELALGGVRLGGSGTVVREFSTDPNFTEDSNNVIPTQRAIATFLANRLSEGGSELETNLLIAGQVRIGSEANTIEHSLDGTVIFPTPVDFAGDNANIRGMLLAQRYFLSKGQV